MVRKSSWQENGARKFNRETIAGASSFYPNFSTNHFRVATRGIGRKVVVEKWEVFAAGMI
jgi:hypothetical protein